jgi:hypothetical protein
LPNAALSSTPETLRMSFTRLALRPLLTGLAIAAIPLSTPAQQAHPPSLDASTQSSVVARFIDELRAGYVFPAKVPAVERALRTRLNAGAYSGEGPSPFATALTADVYAVLHDKHVRVEYHPEVIPPRAVSDEPTADELKRFYEDQARNNYGFARVQRLAGNVGYIDLRGFASAGGTAPTLASAMTFVAQTQALIIDLRRNHGGDPETVSLLCSYLLAPDNRVHVNDLAMRDGNREDVQQFWTSQVPGPHYVDKPVYVLTGSHTFSGAEEFAYDVKNLKRATLVGETTGGGANPGDFARLSDHFEAFIPRGRAISPVTHTNWEGVGVVPDIPTSYDDALKTAYLAALRSAASNAMGADDKSAYDDLIATVTKQTPDQILSN